MARAMNVLVVDDDNRTARFLRRALQEEGHLVDIVGDGAAAIECSLKIRYGLIILDWTLPGTDGIAVCRNLRDRGSDIPILMLTARANVTERIFGLNAGADDYLTKPFDVGELLARVRALGRRGSGTYGLVRIGPLVLNRPARQATLNEHVVEFTRKEFELLTYLVRHSGRVVPRTELLNRIWETTYDTGSNVIEAHIKKLRNKLGKYADMIETVRGVGYRLDSTNAPKLY